jgi:hypothetical protein
VSIIFATVKAASCSAPSMSCQAKLVDRPLSTKKPMASTGSRVKLTPASKYSTILIALPSEQAHEAGGERGLLHGLDRGLGRRLAHHVRDALLEGLDVLAVLEVGQELLDAVAVQGRRSCGPAWRRRRR